MSRPYDRERLVELFGGDAATIAEVEREFLDTARSAGMEIGKTDDFEAIARAAHRVKGAAGMIGADALSQVAATVEKAARAHDLPGVRRLDGSFSQEVARVAALMSLREAAQTK